MTQSDEMQLKLAEKLVKAGDFRRARQIAKEIAEGAPNDSENQARAKRILKSTGIDPLAIVFFALTFLLITFLFFKYVI